MEPRIVLVDPFRDEQLLELVRLSGSPVDSVRVWPFELRPDDRVVSTVPVPRAAVNRALGVLVGVPATPGVGEAWPTRVVTLDQGREEILAAAGGADQPTRRVVGVVGLSGGVGASTLAAALARHLATLPLAVALMDLDPTPALENLLFLRAEGGARIADFAAETGPLLPHRCAAVLPTWNRVRVATNDHRGRHGAPVEALAHALARAHDVLVLDLPRATVLDGGTGIGELCDDLVTVGAGRPGESEVQGTLRARFGRSNVVEVQRTAVSRQAWSPGCALRLGTEKAAHDVEHGVQPGDRPRGAVRVAAGQLAEALGLVP